MGGENQNNKFLEVSITQMTHQSHILVSDVDLETADGLNSETVMSHSGSSEEGNGIHLKKNKRLNEKMHVTLFIFIYPIFKEVYTFS